MQPPRVLFHHPLSFSSQIVRLAAAECEVSLALVDVDIGPGHENYAPWYFAINPKAVVPTLVDDGSAITDCVRISQFLESTSGGEVLTPDDPEACKTAAHWIERQQTIRERELSYGLAAGIAGRLARLELGHRRRLLKRRQRQNPALAGLYEAKLMDLEAWQHCLRDPRATQSVIDEAVNAITDLESHLADRTYVAGDRYSLADVVWTVLLARVRMLGMENWLSPSERPNVAAYFQRMRQRPSFAAAPIHTQLPKSYLIRALFRAHGKNLALVGLSITAGLLLIVV